MQDLCLHNEYVEPLHEEIMREKAEGSGEQLEVERLPLLDSFVKESIRYSNADASAQNPPPPPPRKGLTMFQLAAEGRH